MSFVAVYRRTAFFAVLLLLATFVVPLGFSSHAFADDEEYVRQLFEEGREYFEDGDYIQAAETFLEVEDVLESPPAELYHNIGQAYLRGEQLAKAEKFLQKYLSEATAPPNEDEVAEIIIDIQEQRAAQIATVELNSSPAGAEIFVDDESQCQAPCSVDLDPGEYSLRATLTDHVDATKDIELEPREDTEVTLSLDQMTFVGFLDVRTDVDDAVLEVDGRQYDLPHSEPVELEAASYAITLRRGQDSVTHDIDIERDETLQLFIPVGHMSDGDLSTTRAAAIGLGGASLALAIAATTTGMQARSTHQRLETQQGSVGHVDADLIDSGRNQQRASNFLWLGAVSTLAAGAGLWTWDVMQRSNDDDEQLEPTEVEDKETKQRQIDAEDTPEIDVL